MSFAAGPLGPQAFRLQNLNFDFTDAATHYVAITAAAIIFYLFYKFSSPPMDSREPPVLKPKIPMVGHIVGLAQHGIDYLEVLRRHHPSASAGTMPMLNGKSYVLFDRGLITSAIRHRNLTFDIVSMEFAQRVFGLSSPTMEKLWGPDHDIEKSAAGVTMQRIKGAMQGQNLYRMNATALNYVAERLNVTGKDGLRVENLYRWLRDFMTMATAEGLYGSGNPLRGISESEVIEALWTFESNMQPLFLGFLPQLVARTAYTNRERVQAALAPWYAAHQDSAPDVAEITKVRATTAREFGVPDEEIGRMEVALLFVATANTIPTLYWFLTNVWLRPDVVEELRKETLPLVGLSQKNEGGRVATLDISRLEEQCPLMVSCYRESIRLGNQSVGTRRIVHDTVLSDSTGNQYLLKAGMDVMWSVKGMHHSTGIWGKDAMEFEASRFTEEDKFDRAQKQGYIPFGGGKHLCPGRNFAFAENLGLMAALVVGFEMDGLDEANVKLGWTRIGEAVAKPPMDAQGGEVVIKRRGGWEDVEWKFLC